MSTKKPTADTVLKDIHETRERLLREHGGVAGLAAFLRQLESSSGRPLVKPGDIQPTHPGRSPRPIPEGRQPPKPE